jgi:hypothetical protein
VGRLDDSQHAVVAVGGGAHDASPDVVADLRAESAALHGARAIVLPRTEISMWAESSSLEYPYWPRRNMGVSVAPAPFQACVAASATAGPAHRHSEPDSRARRGAHLETSARCTCGLFVADDEGRPLDLRSGDARKREEEQTLGHGGCSASGRRTRRSA